MLLVQLKLTFDLSFLAVSGLSQVKHAEQMARSIQQCMPGLMKLQIDSQADTTKLGKFGDFVYRTE